MTIHRRKSGSPAVGTPPPDGTPRLSMQAGPPCRYVVERCPGGGDRVEVIDLERKPLRRVVARTSWRDAHMIADALNATSFRHVRYGTDAQWREAIDYTERMLGPKE